MKSRSYPRVPVARHYLTLGRVIIVQRVKLVGLFNRKLSLTVPDEGKALPADGRSQPPANRGWLAQRAEMLNQA